MNIFKRLFGFDQATAREKIVALGDNAKRVMEETPVRHAVADMKFAAFMAFERCQPSDVDGLVAASMQMQAAKTFEGQLEQYIEDGKMEQHLAEEEERTREDRQRFGAARAA